MPSLSDIVGEGIVFLHCPVGSFVRSSSQISLPRYLMNGSKKLDKTYREYSLAPTDDTIRFWKSKVKGQGYSRPRYVAVM